MTPAVIDVNGHDHSPLHLWNAALRKFGVLKECEKTWTKVQAMTDPDEYSVQLRDEALALAEAARALQKLASLQTRKDLEFF